MESPERDRGLGADEQPRPCREASLLEERGLSRRVGQLESRWIRVEGLPVHARVSADAAPSGSLPVVLVHGIGVASRFMVPVAELLAPYHPVYAPDLPGFGASGEPNRVLNVVELTDALAGWTRTIGLERAALRRPPGAYARGPAVLKRRVVREIRRRSA